jgi:DNA-binding NarL/FixJ family response regulator
VLAGSIYLPPSIMAPGAAADTPHAAPGDQRLTSRQQDVLELLCQGASNKAIAAQLDVAEHRARTWCRDPQAAARNRTEASYQRCAWA